MTVSFEPSYWTRIKDPSIKNVFLTGCGGGFDFVHSMTIYEQLRALGKNVVIGSYSFGNPMLIQGNEDTAFDISGAWVKEVDGKCKPHPSYGPEVGMCKFLDSRFPDTAPHSIYAYYARDWVVPTLTELYTRLCTKHEIDAVISFDGGSDSLMAGNEDGLGDPIEDAVTVATIAQLPAHTQVKLTILFTIGVGCDRFNGVSDAATLRAVGELNQAGGFLGSMALERTSPMIQFYDACVTFLQQEARFRSVIANSIIEASKGMVGSDRVPETLRDRVEPGELYLWPLMAFHFAFDPVKVHERSFLGKAILTAPNVTECYERLGNLRSDLFNVGHLLKSEKFPMTNSRL